jgi:hypothetical protein
MNLWRMPLSDLETDVGQPQLVKKLDYGGFSYDNSKTLAGDFGDITPSDDGTADHIIWHAQPNGGVLLWAVGGGSDTTPRLWQDLRTGGWSYADSQPMVGDVNGDGWDDLGVLHRNYGGVANVWVFLSDGQRLGPPQLWSTTAMWGAARYMLADTNGDGNADLVQSAVTYTTTTYTGGAYVPSGPALLYLTVGSNGSNGFSGQVTLFQGSGTAGWSYFNSRLLIGDVTGDGMLDMVTVHAQPNGGILVWMHEGYRTAGGYEQLRPPVIWQDLRTGGWSFAGSRQYLADTDGDGVDDLVSVHSQSGNPGLLVWRHLSTGSGLQAPQVVADLRTGGWTYAASRESVADLYGLI